MNLPPSRGPLPSPPDEPGWWQASDGQWYAPELAPGAAPPAPAPGAPPFGPPPGGPLPGGPPPGAVLAPPAPPGVNNGLAIAALVCGIASLLFCFANIVLGIVAIVLGTMGLKKAKQLPGEAGRGMALGGLITGIIGLLWGVLWIVLWIAVIAATDSATDVVRRAQEDFGVARSSDYKIENVDATVDEFGTAECTGEITNTSDRDHGFSIDVKYFDADGDRVDSSSTIANDLAPGESTEWSALTSNEDVDTCKVSEVRYFG